jgi:hypothetical protein
MRRRRCDVVAAVCFLFASGSALVVLGGHKSRDLVTGDGLPGPIISHSGSGSGLRWLSVARYTRNQRLRVCYLAHTQRLVAHERL